MEERELARLRREVAHLRKENSNLLCRLEEEIGARKDAERKEAAMRSTLTHQNYGAKY